jgi:hypothetical protein
MEECMAKNDIGMEQLTSRSPVQKICHSWLRLLIR